MDQVNTKLLNAMSIVVIREIATLLMGINTFIAPLEEWEKNKNVSLEENTPQLLETKCTT